MERGVLLVNLGSPDSPQRGDVRRYLAQFLMDECVIDVHYLLRLLIVYGTILPTRPKVSAAAYQKIWTEEGSPLVSLSKQLRVLVQKNTTLPVALGMRYGNPSIAKGIEWLMQQKPSMQEIYLIPLYPHFANSSTQTAILETQRILANLGSTSTLKVFPPFYQDAGFIEALVDNASNDLDWEYDHLLFSYHGLPDRHIRKSDPTHTHCLISDNCCKTPSPAHATCYRHQVYATTQAFVDKAKIDKRKYSVSFQSRLGRDPWLRPFTDHRITELARAGVKKLLIMCPAFVTDCLETLEEIGIRAREDFLSHGGQELRLGPCLNTRPKWVSTVTGWIQSPP